MSFLDELADLAAAIFLSAMTLWTLFVFLLGVLAGWYFL